MQGACAGASCNCLTGKVLTNPVRLLSANCMAFLVCFPDSLSSSVALGMCSYLTSLNISGSAVTSEGVKVIVRALAGLAPGASACLKSLELSSCRGICRELRGASARSFQDLVDVIRVS